MKYHQGLLRVGTSHTLVVRKELPWQCTIDLPGGKASQALSGKLLIGMNSTASSASVQELGAGVPAGEYIHIWNSVTYGPEPISFW
jgi:hypothetical protein